MKTGAKVTITIQYENRKPAYYASEEVDYESVKVQTDNTGAYSPLKKLQPQVAEHHTPVKRKRNVSPVLLERASRAPCTGGTSSSSTISKAPRNTKPRKENIPELMVKDLPSSKKRGSKFCSICKLEWESEEDKKYRKGQKFKTTWIGCDKSRCKFWAHASCVGILIAPGRDIKDIEFLCATHKKR